MAMNPQANPFYNNDSSEPAIRGQSPFVDMTFERGVLIVHPVGPSVGEREAPVIAGDVQQQMESLHGRLKVMVLDLRSVRLLPSMGLGLCIDLQRNAASQQAKTLLFGLSRELRELFRMMRIERMFTLVHSQEDLLRAIESELARR